MVETITWKTKEKAKERQKKRTACMNQPKKEVN
jgi:hypothetical protein